MLILRNINERLESKATIDLLTTQAQYLENEIEKLTSNYGIIAQDDAMLRVLEKINQVARTDATVLVRGETGTGKELVARALHNASDRSSKPLIKINCGAIPANLIESELFGHEKGAFTGAVSSRKGRFLLANQGTLFLDEIGELPIELQPKLLRVIQEGEFEAVGSSETQKVDVRIIAATHRNLLEFSKKGKFREDLYYRLNVFPIQVPPLRDRRTDIILIAEEMLRRFSEKMNTPVFPLSESDKALFESYGWPGNVRELQNLIERAVIVSDEGRINWQAIIPVNDPVEDNSMKAGARCGLSSQELLDLERENLLLALKRCSWRISGRNGAASLLKVPESTLRSRIKALGLERPV
jgi:transcriptional regulator with GAF, ATPase, and Fis domain